MIFEGMTVVEVSRQLGHSSQTCLSSYARVFEDFDPDHRVKAEQVIADARTATAASAS